MNAVSLISPRGVVELIDSLVEVNRVILITALGKDDLLGIVSSDEGLSVERLRAYWNNMVRGLLEIKQVNIAHGDVSLENIVIFEDDSAKFIDFGSSQLVTGPIATLDYKYIGKLAYIPPEVVSATSIVTRIDPHAIDVWALGCCLYAMSTGRGLYADPDDSGFMYLEDGRAMELMMHYRSLGVRIPTITANIVERMLKPDPSDRPSIEEVALFVL
jgi:serine/threonine protein kinase